MGQIALGGVTKGLGHPTAAHQLVQADSVHLYREGVREAATGGVLVVEEGVDGLDRRCQARFGCHAVHEVLGKAQIFARRPDGLDVGAHRTEIADQEVVGIGGAGVAAHAALGAAQGDVAGLRVVVRRFLHGHATGQARHLVECAAGAHP